MSPPKIDCGDLKATGFTVVQKDSSKGRERED